MPDVTVEIAFDSGYTTPEGDRTWTDVSERVEGQEPIDITRGRGDERAEIDASVMTVTLDNVDGAFTPNNASSPYYPNVKKGRPIRVTVTYAGSDYVRFTGYVDEWPVQWSDGGDEMSTAVVKASSRMARLAQSAELRSIVEETILALSPSVYYPLGDAEGATAALDASGNRRTATLAGTGADPLFGTATGVGTDGLTAVQFPGGGKVIQFGGGQQLADAKFTMFGFYNTTSSVGFIPLTIGSGPVSEDVTVGAMLDVSNGALLGAVKWRDIAGNTSFVIGVGDNGFNDGKTHFAAMTVDMTVPTGSGTMILYDENGVITTQAITTANALSPAPVWARIGDGSAGTTMHVGVVPTVLTAAQVASIAEAGLSAGYGESSGARITRLAALAKIPADEVNAAPGLSTSLINQHSEESTAISLMQAVADTESGLIFDGRDGHLVFYDRAQRYDAVSAFTLDVSAQEVGADLQPVLDDVGMVNDASATGGTDATIAVRAVNQASVDDYGAYRATRDLLSTNVNEMQAAADWLVSRLSQPLVRIPTVPVDVLDADASRQADLLDADIDTRFTLTNLPRQAPATTMEFVIEGYSESISAMSHSITFNVSAGTLYDVLMLDDATRGRLDSEYILAY